MTTSTLMRCGICLALVLALAMFGATGSAAAQQKVEVPSLDAADGQPLRLPGWWFAAAGAGPAPALLLLHGCGGVFGQGDKLASRYRELADRLNALGVHALVLDSLSPRGETELCTQRTGSRKVSQLQRRRDALGALRWLAALPGVDAERIGLIGWSNGGSTVLAATNRRHPEVASSTQRPSLAVAFYPGCESELQRGYEATAPLLMLVGDADDWTPPGPCKALQAAGTGAGAGAAIELVAYPGAYHGFDGVGPVRLRGDVPNGVHPGRGVHVGGNPEARAASAQRLEAFLRSHWKLPAP